MKMYQFPCESTRKIYLKLTDDGLKPFERREKWDSSPIKPPLFKSIDEAISYLTKKIARRRRRYGFSAPMEKILATQKLEKTLEIIKKQGGVQ
jgi:hypothetical protein